MTIPALADCGGRVHRKDWKRDVGDPDVGRRGVGNGVV